MVQLFFVSVLVLTTRTPALGWIQWTESYSEKKICEDIIRRDYSRIEDAVKTYLGAALKQVRQIRCSTYQEALKMNTELGH